MHHSVASAQLDFLGTPVPESTISVPELKSGRRTGSVSRSPARLCDTPLCEITTDDETGTLWVRLKAGAPVKFTPALLTELRQVQEQVAARVDDRRTASAVPHFQVFASRIPGVFSLGGDLALFQDCIARRDAHGLRAYARDAVDLVHTNAVGYDGPVTTISLVQGQALGGGFEAALASHVLVAERGARMGLPEVMFNMFPGMGAFQLLCQRLTPAQAEKMILGGRTYTAEELHDLGVVDVLADDGDGENVVRRYIATHHRQHHGHAGFRRARQAASPLDRHELYRVADVWVETALGLGPRDLETIAYLLRAQERMAARALLEVADSGVLMNA